MGKRDRLRHSLKAIINDTKLYLHHKDALKRLFLEVDASDVGWGACAYCIRCPATTKAIRVKKEGCA
jgi:hypothetical protein